jgi:hypothetical protein
MSLRRAPRLPRVRLLFDVAVVLHEIERGEDERPEWEKPAARQ